MLSRRTVPQWNLSLANVWVLAACVLVLPGHLAASSSGAWSNITEYSVPFRTAPAMPQGIATGPDGALWFTGEGGGYGEIGRITTNGVITLYPVPAPPNNQGVPQLEGITLGPDGALWFTEVYGDTIVRMTTDGSFTQFPLPDSTPSDPNQTSFPTGITTGPDGNLWFTYNLGIGRITTTGVMTEFPGASTPISPSAITAGSDGALWFANGLNSVGRITTDGIITRYQLPTPGSVPLSITAGPDGALWFTETNTDGITSQVGRITTSGAINEYPLSASTAPYGITAGPDGALWFTEGQGHSIGRITTSGVITTYPLALPLSTPHGITAGPDGALWFVDWFNSVIGKAPACGLGFNASFAAGTLTMNFNLGIDTPANFDIVLVNSTGPFEKPFSRAISAEVPPTAFTMTWKSFPNLGTIKVRSALGSGPGQGYCAEWSTVNTTQ
jgi:virginiamycin B lyase